MNFENDDAKNTYDYLCKKHNIKFTIFKNRYDTVSKAEIIEFVDEFIKRFKRS